jgi:hypothetical protein
VLTSVNPGAGAVWDLAATRTAIVTYAGLATLHPLADSQPPCTVVLDTALSSCDVSAEGTVLAVGGSAGTALFQLPAWAAGPTA